MGFLNIACITIFFSPSSVILAFNSLARNCLNCSGSLFNSFSSTVYNLFPSS